MNHKRNLLILGSTAVLLLSFCVPAPAQIEQKTTCPVMPGERIDKRFYVDYHGKRIYLCCKACKKSFKKHPERYLKNLE